MSISSIIFIVFGAFVAIAGLASLITGKVYMFSSASQYTDESLHKFSRPMGLSNLLSGGGLVLSEVLDKELFQISGVPVKSGMIALVVLVILGGVVYFAGKKVLVRK